MNHKNLIEIGQVWLAKRCPVVITELSSAAGECPDILGFEGRVHDVGFGTHLIECKISRSDFRADAKKFYRRVPDEGMGDYRYYFAIKGLIAIEELPDKWGLLELTDSGKIFLQVIPQRQDANKRSEISLLLSTMRRLKLDDGCHCSLRVKSYNIQTKNSATLTIDKEMGE